MEELANKLSTVIAKAMRDPQYRQLLEKAPTRVLEIEGITAPEGFEFVVTPNSATKKHIPIPLNHSEGLFLAMALGQALAKSDQE